MNSGIKMLVILPMKLATNGEGPCLFLLMQLKYFLQILSVQIFSLALI